MQFMNEFNKLWIRRHNLLNRGIGCQSDLVSFYNILGKNPADNLLFRQIPAEIDIILLENRGYILEVGIISNYKRA